MNGEFQTLEITYVFRCNMSAIRFVRGFIVALSLAGVCSSEMKAVSGQGKAESDCCLSKCDR